MRFASILGNRQFHTLYITSSFVLVCKPQAYFLRIEKISQCFVYALCVSYVVCEILKLI